MEDKLSSDIIVDVIEATIRVLIGTGLTRDDAPVSYTHLTLPTNREV